MLLNCSNHPYTLWPENQKKAAEAYGTVTDYAFPPVAADCSEEDIEHMAAAALEDILKVSPDCVMCQGEFTLTFSLVDKLKAAGIPVIAACSERVATCRKDENGNEIRTSVFRFVRFRKYI